NVTIPASVVWVALRWRLARLIPSTTTRPVLGNTRSTVPRLPASSPEITWTVSPLVMCSFMRAGVGSVRTRFDLRWTSGFMSEHLRSQRDDLHVALLAELARHGTEDAGRLGLALVVDQHRSVLVEPDVGAVLAADFLRGPDDHRLGDVTLLHLARWDRVLDRHHHPVTQGCVAAARPAQHADHQRPPGAGVVRDLENALLLHHRFFSRGLTWPARRPRRCASERSSPAVGSP